MLAFRTTELLPAIRSLHKDTKFELALSALRLANGSDRRSTNRRSFFWICLTDCAHLDCLRHTLADAWRYCGTCTWSNGNSKPSTTWPCRNSESRTAPRTAPRTTSRTERRSATPPTPSASSATPRSSTRPWSCATPASSTTSTSSTHANNPQSMRRLRRERTATFQVESGLGLQGSDLRYSEAQGWRLSWSSL